MPKRISPTRTAFVSHDDRIHDNIIVIFKVVLFQYGETLAGSDNNITFSGFQVSGQNF